ncbi:hypothetical protein MGYG_08395 [Nannizzia gypsea CBS 118893]|uniref:Uncharacterized protein n=1 Tax=Arthroderma gypseum (strain ATCC MYA-4604 / CBS 118893) TaxID=535722 RepID=E4V5K9_ARTGP|nr:hypothetical protein MGYG_08395 [Nannizzia gypsea CBS 118893]EFR05384.1 hypothetical protein MGYG_08395 [Nannizzia gypsea CBS 118893]
MQDTSLEEWVEPQPWPGNTTKIEQDGHQTPGVQGAKSKEKEKETSFQLEEILDGVVPVGSAIAIIHCRRFVVLGKLLAIPVSKS